MFDLLILLRKDPDYFHYTLKPGQRFKSMELVWSEVASKASYNPCQQFNDTNH